MDVKKIVNDLLASGMRLAEPETLRKTRVLNAVQLVLIVAMPLLGVFYFFLDAIRLFFICMISGLFMASALALLRMTRNVLAGSHYALAILCATVLAISWNTGAVSFEGALKPILMLNSALVLLAIFMTGYPGGAIWSTIIFVETGMFVYLWQSGYEFPNLIAPHLAATYSLGTYLVALLVMLLLSFLFEMERTEALTREEEKTEALRASKRYIDNILERSPVATFILDRNHRVIHWNQACRELTGIPAEEVLGQKVWEGLKDNERGSLADLVLDAPDAVERHYGDAILSRTADGWVELRAQLHMLKGRPQAIVTAAPILDGNGAVRGAIQTITTSDSQAQLYEPAVCEEGSPGAPPGIVASPAFRIDTLGNITYWNQACEKAFGYSSPEILGKSAFTLVAKHYIPSFKKSVVDAFRGEAFASKDWRCRNKEGKPVYVIARGYTTESPDGTAKECVILLTDVTELRLRIRQLEVYASETKEKLKSITEEHSLLKKNIASFLRKKKEPSQRP